MLGMVWTEYEKKEEIIPWPMKDYPKSPSKWIEECRRWNGLLELYAEVLEEPKEEEILNAWCAFLLDERSDKHNRVDFCERKLDLLNNSPDVVALGSRFLGFAPELHESTRKFLRKKSKEKEVDLLARKFARKSLKPLSRLTPNELAFVFENPKPNELGK